MRARVRHINAQGGALVRWLRRRRAARREPVFMKPRGRLDPEAGPNTFVMVCGRGFDQRRPNAATMMRQGWCHGFERIGVPYVFASALDLPRVLASVPGPMCWISGSDFRSLDAAALRSLRACRHAVLVTISFDGDERYFREHGLPSQAWSPHLRRCILSTEPRFLFTMSHSSRFEYYAGWLNAGARLVSLPLACDTHVYAPAPVAVPEFTGIDVAFVGGYWNYKARQLDRYLQPLADRLHVFGYTPWPYGEFGGELPAAQEPALYAQARLCPVINEPHVALMGVDINERVFKVLGSGGLALTDATPGYRAWFSADELLVPESVDDFRALAQAALSDPDAMQHRRQRGLQAVLDRHTYAHRALEFMRQMGVAAPTGAAP
jgi:hypothetical protein